MPDRSERAPVLILVHGFKGFKDWGSFPWIADAFAADGWCVVRFNFTHNGIGEDGQSFTELDRFRRNTYSREVNELEDVVDAVVSGKVVPADADTERIAVLGHSRGGGIALLGTSRDTRIRAAAVWGSISTVDRWGPALKRTWRERGVLEIMNTRTRQRMPLGVELLDDAETHRDELDILAAMRRLSVPVLIVHGEQDVSVSPDEARRLQAAGDASLCELVMLPNADHTFGAAHPWAGMPPALSTALTRTRFWLRMNTRA